MDKSLDGQKVQTKIKISWKRKELLTWNKAFFIISKGLSVTRNYLRPETAPLNRPGRFPRIAWNAGNHENDRKFHESHKILNQI